MIEDELSIDNILDSNEIDNLFIMDDETPEDNNEPQEKNNDDESKTKDDKTTETVEIDELFEESESVGSEDDLGAKEDTTSSKGDGSTSSNNNFYSSIAKALKEEGIFHTLEDSAVESIKTPEDFAEAINSQLQSMLDEKQKRIDEALTAGVESSQIQQYERVINYLQSLEESSITDESENGETLRKQLIYQDLINRGYSKARAEREVKKSIDAGSDIEDAKDALNSNLEYYQGEYDNIIKEAKESKAKEDAEIKEQTTKLKKSILEDDKVFGEIQVDKTSRMRILDNISKPVYKDPDSGELFTAIQKYERENRTDFLKYVGLFYTLTDGFKNIDSLVKNKVKKEVSKGIRNLERTINNTSRTSDGSLNYASGVHDSESSYKGWTIDVEN